MIRNMFLVIYTQTISQIVTDITRLTQIPHKLENMVFYRNPICHVIVTYTDFRITAFLFMDHVKFD